jgi:hypothetical protein
MIRLGRTKTDLGYAWSSGDAYGSDRAFWYGAKQSERYNEIGARIYLAEDGNNRRRVKDMPFFYDALAFEDTYSTARALASLARGGWGGLGEWGIRQHTRNAFQIHGHTLQELVKELWYYAEPIGKRENERVHGGTNTAVRLAVDAGVPVRVNLYFEDSIRLLDDWLKANESDEPYEEIDWRQIHDPRDPRLTEF